MGKIRIRRSVLGPLIELLQNLFKGEIEKLVQKEVANEIKNFVNKDLAKLIAGIDFIVPVPVPKPFHDSGLHFYLKSITAYNDHLGADISVGIVDPKNPSRLVKQPVSSAIPDFFDGSKMLSLSMSPEVLDDIVQFHQGKWEHTVHAHEMPKDSPMQLDSNTLSLITTPPLKMIFGGGKDMQVTFSVGGPSTFNFSEGVVYLNLPSRFKFDVKHDDGKLEHAFTLEAPVDGVATLKIQPDPQKIQMELTKLDLTSLSTKEKHISMWAVNTLLLSPMLGYLENRVILPELNRLFRGGIACCEHGGFALRQLSTRISPGAFTVFSDIEIEDLLRRVL